VRRVNIYAKPLLAEITPGDCDEWHSEQVAQGYAQATIGRDVKRARQFFRAAMRKKLIAENPFADVKAAAMVNKSREFFITAEATAKLIAACPDTEWRLIVALARYGGLRTPSETYALRWGDVDCEKGRMRVISPKTAHHQGGESRIIPLFPELRPFLEAAFDEAESGTEHVISRHRSDSQNLRTQMQRIIERADLTAWPRLFQNMRASRETELTHKHPLHVVVAWIGNSAR
jgi:integrase